MAWFRACSFTWSAVVLALVVFVAAPTGVAAGAFRDILASAGVLEVVTVTAPPAGYGWYGGTYWSSWDVGLAPTYFYRVYYYDPWPCGSTVSVGLGWPWWYDCSYWRWCYYRSPWYSYHYHPVYYHHRRSWSHPHGHGRGHGPTRTYRYDSPPSPAPRVSGTWPSAAPQPSRPPYGGASAPPAPTYGSSGPSRTPRYGSSTPS